MAKLVNRKAGINIMWVSNIYIMINILIALFFAIGKLMLNMNEFNRRTNYNFERLLNIEESAPMLFYLAVIIISIILTVIAGLMVASVPIVNSMYNKGKNKEAMIITVANWVAAICWIIVQVDFALVAHEGTIKLFDRTVVPTIFTITSIIITLLSV